MSKLKWFLSKIVDIAVDMIAGYLLFLILGDVISQPLSEINPNLPILLVVSLIISIVVGFFYRFYKSIRFHRFIERISSSLVNFLKDWDKLRHALDEAVESQESERIRKFEDVRTQLQYDYVSQEVTYAVKVMKYERIDRVLGIHVRNYDVIGNLLAKSPFIEMREYRSVNSTHRDFIRDWDLGRTILVGSIGYFNRFRKNAIHQLYWILRLVPIPKEQEGTN